MRTTGSMSEDEKRRLVLTLLTKLQCAECQQSYSAHDFTLIHKQRDVWMLEAHCHNCGDNTHVVVAIKGEDEVDPVSDLTPEELESLGEGPPITADDVLDMHLLLQTLEVEPFDFAD